MCALAAKTTARCARLVFYRCSYSITYYGCSTFIITQRWARAYRDDEYHAAVNTNNGVEALNRVLKYRFLLNHKKSMNLFTVITILFEMFLPDIYQKYLYCNYKQSSSYRSYKSFVPEYLHGRPRALYFTVWIGRHKAQSIAPLTSK